MSIFCQRWPFLKTEQSHFSFQFPFNVLLPAPHSSLLVGSWRFPISPGVPRSLRQNFPRTFLEHRSAALNKRWMKLLCCKQGAGAGTLPGEQSIPASQWTISALSLLNAILAIAEVNFACWVEGIVRHQSPVELVLTIVETPSALISTPAPLWLCSTDMPVFTKADAYLSHMVRWERRHQQNLEM